MAFTTLSTTQNEFLHNYLRGTNRSLTSAQAESLYGIKNLRARMSELRWAGLQIRREKATTGYAKYSISARDIWGSKASLIVK